MSKQGNSQNTLYSLIPLDDFKALLGVDDREDKTARFCLVTSTLSIEQYCKRRFLRKKYFERIDFYGFVPRLDYSGTIQRHGHITKRGNAYLRALLVQAAWSAIRSKRGGALRTRFKYYTLTQEQSKKKTIVSIARKMAELMYSVLRSKTAYETRKWNGPQERIKPKFILENCA